MEVGKLKGLLGIPEGDTSQDLSLEFIIDDVTETILSYCNLEALPTGLTNTAYRMAIDLYRYDRPGVADIPQAVTAISEGDTSTSFTSAADALAGGILKDYQGQLNRFRKLRW